MNVRLPDRFAQPAEDYLAQHGVDVFLRDVVQQILALRGDQPLLTISKYFSAAGAGTHVSGRAFVFVDACARNRLAFVRLFQVSFAGNIDAQERITVEDYHQLCQMLCPDFPVRVVRAAVRTLPGDKLAFADLSRAVHLYFFYRHFLKEVERIFRDASTLVLDNAAGGDEDAENIVLDESGAKVISFDCNVVHKTLARMFYIVSCSSNDSGHGGASTASAAEVLSSGGKGVMEMQAASPSVAANSTYFEAAAIRRGDDASANVALGMCVPPFWGLEKALISACDLSIGGCSYAALMRSFVAVEGLAVQLRDATLKPPMCAIATSAVACDHEARAYRLMEAMVVSDVTAQAKSNKSLDSRSGIERSGGSSGDGKRSRRKKSQRRR